MNKNRVLTLLSAFALLLTGRLHAAQIQGVTVNAVSGQYVNLVTSNPDLRYATNVLGRTGLFGDIGTPIPGGAEWLVSGGGQAATNFIVFDLGAVHTVNAMKVWNFNQAGAGNLVNDLKSAYISYSTDDVNFTTNYPGGQFFAQAPGTFSAFAQTITTNMGFSARYVRIDVITNWATSGGGVGLSKVRFIDDSVPPTMLSASENFSSNQVTVVYSESVDPASATNLVNYSIQSGTGSATILSAAMGEFNDRVILQTSPLTNQNYSVVASGVYDAALTTSLANNSTVAIQPELIVWLAANLGLTTDVNGNVTQWNDQSGYGHNALTNLAVNQYSAPPTLLPGALNGLPAVSFTSGQLMNIPNDTNLAINGDVTVCVVLDKTTAAAGDVISKTGGQGTNYTGNPLHGYTNNMPGPFDYQINASQKSTWTWGNGGGGSTGLAGPTATGAFVTGQYYIVTAVVRGTNASWYLNGGFNGSATVIDPPADSGNPMMLGVRLDSGNVGDAGLTFAGNLAEVMVIRGTVTPADLLNINDYLGTKYNIPISTLAINEQPQNATGQVGKTATYWVNAVGVPPLKYQWRTNSVGGVTNNIAGATNAVYTTPPLALADASLLYSVSISTPLGSTNSAPATVTVVNDTTAPTVFSATKTGNLTTVVVNFSEPVDPATGLNAANYTLNNGVSVLSASYGGVTSNSVVLTTSSLDPNAGYYLAVQNVQDLFGNALASVTVPVLPAGLAIYLRGDSGVMLDDNGLVDQWLDQTTNGNNAVQFLGGVAARPTTGGSINGVPVLSFSSGSSNYLQAASSATLAITGDMSIYAVANISDYSAPREILGKTSGNEPASYDYYASSASDLRFLRGNGTVSFRADDSAAPAAGVPHVNSLTSQGGTNVSYFLDGKLVTSTNVTPTTLADAGTPLMIGSRNDLSQYMNGQMGEVMIFGQALSAGDRVAVDNYLGAKYFPFSIGQQPQSVTTNEGVTTTFTVVASQGSAHLNYQWQENSTNVPGATNISYTTSILTPDDNGDTFDVVIIFPDVSTNTSATATLTVNNVQPTIASAGEPIWSQTNIVVLYSEVVDPATATTAGNYSLNSGASVLSAALGDAPNKVVLTISALNPGTAYTLNVQNVMDPFGNTISPASVSVGVYPASTALWIKADTGVTTDANGVNQWNDLSGNGNNLMQSLGFPFEPQLVPNALNGLPVIRFAATNETFLSAGSSSTLAITGDMAVFAVVNFDTLAGNTNAMIVSKTTANIPAPFDYYVRPGQVQFYRGNGTASGLVNSTGVPSTGVPHLLDVVMQGTTAIHRLDGKANGSGTLSTTIGDNGDSLYIGTREDGVDRLSGDMAELIVLGSGVSSNDLASLESYLGAKYKFPIGSQQYPTITQQPVASTNVDQGGTLTVVAAATGNPAVAYQWYDGNNVAVAGQTNATLVISNIQAGGEYYLAATNILGAINSDIVTVNVGSGPPQVSLAPTNATLYAGITAVYTVKALGTLPLYYQWYQNNEAVPNATNVTYSFLTLLGTNNYSCSVRNSFSTVSSGNVTLIGAVAAPTNLYPQTVLGDSPVAYWRLDERNDGLNDGNPGVVAHDYVGGHNATCNNVNLGLAGYDPLMDPDTAAQFGVFATSNSYAGEIDQSGDGIANIDFATPTGGNAEFSIEAWVNSTNASQVGGAGIVSKGYGGGGEQFDLDLFGNAFRFFVRDASGLVHGPTSTVVPAVGQWYHVVAVWDGANGAAHLYINGADNIDSTGIATGIGLLTATTTNTALPGDVLVNIGARASSEAVTNYDYQFKGLIDEVAIYSYALSSNSVAAHYQAGTVLPPETVFITNPGGGQIQLNWSFGMLQGATNAAGPYLNINNATSPYTIPATNAQQYYRVREK